MRSPSLDHSERSGEVRRTKPPYRGANGAVRFWLIVLGAFAIILLAAIVAAVRSTSSGARNRGPADEAAPGAHPERDIDRSLNR
jgi:hypothetical protein